MATTVDQNVEAMVTPSLEHFAAFEAAMTGTGPEAHAALRAFKEAALPLPGVGQAAAASIAALRKDSSLPADHRSLVSQERRQAAEVLVRKLRAGAAESLGALEGALSDGLLPRAAKDPGDRMLARDELRTILAGRGGDQLLEAIHSSAGTHPHRDAELIGDFGQALLRSHGLESKLVDVRRVVAEKYLQGAGGTERQQASRRAMTEFRSRKIAGRVDAFQQAALMHLRSVD